MIIDSSVLIDIDRGSQKYEKIPDGRHAVSSATVMEISVGVNLGPGRGLDKIGEQLDIMPIDERVAEKAGEITADLKKRGEKIDLNDIYIAATALIHDETILTGNIKHFEKIKGLKVVDWNKI